MRRANFGAVVLAACLAAGSAHADKGAAGLEFVERVDGSPKARAKLPLIVALHGLGDRPENLAGNFPSLPFPARWIFLRGPSASGDGYTWFDPPEQMSDPAALRRVTQRVALAIRELASKRPTRGLPIVTGFSQGGVISFALAARGERIALAIPVSGSLPAGFLPQRRGRRPATLRALHGEIDGRLPAADASLAVEALKRLGGDASIKIYPGIGHSITRDMLLDHRALLEDALRPARARR